MARNELIKNGSLGASVILIILLLIYSFTLKSELSDLESELSSLEDTNEELRHQIKELWGEKEMLYSQVSKLNLEKEELQTYLELYMNNPEPTQTYSRYIKNLKGELEWYSVSGKDEILSFLGANFCMHGPSKLN
ncbi:MAG: hypothetical protein EP332_11270 [Bacteroidetes bacterium]|nr:MAG: hypothetical protein EP332_11270 [Bacteroidota bacterium]